MVLIGLVNHFGGSSVCCWLLWWTLMCVYVFIIAIFTWMMTDGLDGECYR